MRRSMAITLLSGMMLPVFLWAGSSILENRDRSIRNEEREKSSRALLQEVRKDVKLILQRMPTQGGHNGRR